MSVSTLPPGCGHGGEGGGLYSGMNEGTNSLVRSFQNGEGVDSVLLDSVLLSFGVFALSPSKRLQVAENARQLLIEAAELHDLLVYIRDGEPNEGLARRYMAAIVADPIRFRDAVEGLRAFRRAQESMRRATRPADIGPPHMANLPLGSPTCPCVECGRVREAKPPESEPWDHDRQCRVAYCLVRSDRRPLAEVAKTLGVSETTLGVMLDRGRTLSQSAYQPKARQSMKLVRAEAGAEQERREEFARKMREARQVTSG